MYLQICIYTEYIFTYSLVNDPIIYPSGSVRGDIIKLYIFTLMNTGRKGQEQLRASQVVEGHHCLVLDMLQSGQGPHRVHGMFI